jgi:hypothetical protein
MMRREPRWQYADCDWGGHADVLTAKFAELEHAGVDYAGLCAVTPHRALLQELEG